VREGRRGGARGGRDSEGSRLSRDEGGLGARKKARLRPMMIMTGLKSRIARVLLRTRSVTASRVRLRLQPVELTARTVQELSDARGGP
jgi:hypothetical protein